MHERREKLICGGISVLLQCSKLKQSCCWLGSETGSHEVKAQIHYVAEADLDFSPPCLCLASNGITSVH